jgi:NAD-reducing hydrogenase large subunit
MGFVADDGALDLYHGGLRAKDPDGNVIFDHVDYATYERVLTEEVKPWSYMKFPYITELGPDDGWYRVGPLARVMNCDYIPTPLADAERVTMLGAINGAPLNYHWARMVEMLFSAEMIRELLDDFDITGEDLVNLGERRSEGVGVIEAPRGTLFHHYRVGDDDLITMANLIVSTTNNNQAMNTAVREVARQYLDGTEITEGLLNHIEVAIRAFDPCLSCATHALGAMPLEVTLVAPDGTVLDRRVKE